MTRFIPRPVLAISLGVSAIALASAAHAAGRYTLVGWNNLGMHCMDPDYQVFALLPPYNTFQAQLVDPSGQLVDAPNGITVTYEAVADPDGSINSTSVGKSCSRSIRRLASTSSGSFLLTAELNTTTSAAPMFSLRWPMKTFAPSPSSPVPTTSNRSVSLDR